jgi:hypothetical protein
MAGKAAGHAMRLGPIVKPGRVIKFLACRLHAFQIRTDSSFVDPSGE